MKLATTLFSLLLSTTVAADELGGTLKKIKESGTITLGVRDFSVPFSYLDDKQSYQGYAIDLCMQIAKTAQRTLGMSALNVRMVPVNASSRLPLLANGTIDLECGNTTNTVERHVVAEFSPTIFVSSNRFITKKKFNIRTVEDLRGKTVAASSGTSNLANLIKINREKALGMNIVTVPDNAEGFLMLEKGRAVAYAGDDVILATLIAGSKTPDDYLVSAQPLSLEPYGILSRKNDLSFKNLVDKSLRSFYASGDIKKLYAKWFESTIPSKQINLNWSMSLETKAALARPTDSGNPDDYAKAANVK